MAAKQIKNKSIKKLASLIKDVRVAMMTTACPDGSLRSRPMATQRDEFDGELWFFTDDHSAKVDEIEQDRHVNISYADPDENTYVSVTGRAALVKNKGKAKELWSPVYKAWFPKGLNDPRLALIRVTVERAEYWDSPSSKLVQLGGFVKAIATGKRAKPGEHEKVTLRTRPGQRARSAATVKTNPQRHPTQPRPRPRPRASVGRR